MPITIKTPVAIEKGTYVVDITFEDENGNAIAPNTLTWTLTDLAGAVVNSRSGVVVSVMATTITVVLSGNDLALTADSNQQRIFTAEGTYDSINGTNLPIKDQLIFSIQNLRKVIS
jgi:hypothetical protein